MFSQLVIRYLTCACHRGYHLIDSHVALVMKMNAQLNEHRFTQYMKGWVDAAMEMEVIAEDILEAVDEDGVKNPRLDSESLEKDYTWMDWLIEIRRLKRDYDKMVLSIEDQLVECKAAMQTALSKEQ